MPAENPDRDPNDVRTLLDLNVKAQKASEAPIEIPRAPTPRQRRTRTALLALLLIDPLLLLIAWKAGPGNPYPFVFSLSMLGLFTAWICWNAWFLNTR